MKTTYFTIADGPVFGFMATELSRRMRILNGVSVVILKDGLAYAYGVMGRQYWLKAFLWDFVADSVERIVYLDADILPVAPLPDYFLKCEAPFSARMDVERTAISQRSQNAVLFGKIKNYFNNGIFVATREAVPVFNALRDQVNNPVHASCVEQTWQNKFVDEMCGLSVLPKGIGYLVNGEPEPEQVINRHYAGMKNKLELFIRDMAVYKGGC